MTEDEMLKRLSKRQFNILLAAFWLGNTALAILIWIWTH